MNIGKEIYMDIEEDDKMNIEIRLGTEEDIDALAKLYDDLNDHLERTTNYPGWKKGIYPTREDAEAGIKEGCLYVATCDEKIVASEILRHKPEPAYLAAKWRKDVEYDYVLVVYTFVVSPAHHGQGIAKKMLDFAAEQARAMNIKSLRLDVYEKNTPAISLYKKCGFQYIDTVSLGLEEFGLDWFHLYEKVL